MKRKVSGFRAFCIIIVIFFCSKGFTQYHSTPNTLQKSFALKFNKNEVQSSHKNYDWFYTSLEINYVILNAMDLLTTFYSIDKGAKEANPISKLYIRNKPLAVIIKGGVTAGVILGLARVKNQDKKAAYVTLTLLNVMYGFVVKNNFSVYLQLNK